MTIMVKRAVNGSTSRIAGTWYYEEYGEEDEERCVPCVCCPLCGKTSALIDHQVDDDGFVEPSILCTHCHEFEDHIKLEGYKS